MNAIQTAADIATRTQRAGDAPKRDKEPPKYP